MGVPVFWGVGNSGAAVFGVGWIMVWVLVTMMVVRVWGCLLGFEERTHRNIPHLWLLCV